MDRKAKEDIARRAFLLATMPQPATEALLKAATCTSYARGETLFLQGEPATAVHIVINGWVKLYRISPNGGEAVVGVFTKGGSFAEAVALRDLPYPVTAEAVSECEVMHIPASTVKAVIRSDPETAINVLAATFLHLRSLVGQIEQMKAQTGPQRVAEFLLELSPCNKGSCVVSLPYEKALIAGRLGMKPESLSRAFSKLRQVGVVIDGNHASIEDVGRLRDYCEEDPAAAWNKVL